MRQIGVRDEARLVGGFGPCGREHCCGHQGDDFEPVSIKMAKEQNLNLNSQKISGMCGRLLCCLAYEYATYRDMNIQLPKLGTEILALDKKYPVISVNTLDESVSITDNEKILKVTKDHLHFSNGNHYIKKNSVDEIFNSSDENTN